MSNPMLNSSVFYDEKNETSMGVMTVEGAVNKTLFLSILLFASAVSTWYLLPQYVTLTYPITIWAALVWFLMVLSMTFLKKYSKYLAVIYAIVEWVFVWAISSLFEAAYPGIVMQGVALTFAVFALMLVLYRWRIIKVTAKLRAWIIVATLAVAVIYLISFILSFFSITFPYIHEAGAIWIWFSIFVVWLAAFNLLLDFDNIEQWAAASAPKYMEWYVSVWLLVTLVWLYLEILKLLSKLASRE